MFFKSKPQPTANLNVYQIVDHFKKEVNKAIDTAMEGRSRDFPLQRDIARALRDAAQLIDVRMAMTQPIV